MDERLINIKNEQQKAINASNTMYNNLINENKALYDQQTNYLNEQEKILNNNLDKQLANQTQKIQQQKDAAQKNYETETKKALNDYTSFTNPYGYQAESLAQSGLNNSGVSETSKLGGFNVYQNRLASANKVMQDAFTNYDMQINDAILSNDVAKAENALNKLNQALNYMQSYYSNKATITQNQFAAEQDINNNYFNRYQTEYQNIQNEKDAQEAIRQFNASLAEDKRQYDESMAYQRELNKLSSSNSKTSGSSKGTTRTSNNDVLLGETTTKNIDKTSVKKNPYTNDIHPDAYNGTFDNGYQPNNVDGNKLTKSDYKVKDIFNDTAYGSTGVALDNQKVWSTNGRYYVWDGSINDYIDVTTAVKNVTGNKKNNTYVIWGTTTESLKK